MAIKFLRGKTKDASERPQRQCAVLTNPLAFRSGERISEVGEMDRLVKLFREWSTKIGVVSSFIPSTESLQPTKSFLIVVS